MSTDENCDSLHRNRNEILPELIEVGSGLATHRQHLLV